MTHDKQKVIDIALAEVGYLEKASNSQLDSKTANAGSKNRTKYARDLANISFYNGNKQGVAWCDVFVDWCFVQAFGKANTLAMTYQPTNAKNNSGAGCKHSRNYYKSKGKLFDVPQAGDQIFFYGTKDGKVDKTQIAHTGLVYKVDSKKVYTVEGNTSGASGVVANGGGVCKKSYNLTYGRIAGYGRPNWGEQSAAVLPPKPTENAQAYTLYTIKKGDTLWRIAQKHLGRGDRYKEIMQLNSMHKDVIYAGKQLKIPKG